MGQTQNLPKVVVVFWATFLICQFNINDQIPFDSLFQSKVDFTIKKFVKSINYAGVSLSISIKNLVNQVFNLAKPCNKYFQSQVQGKNFELPIPVICKDL